MPGACPSPRWCAGCRRSPSSRPTWPPPAPSRPCRPRRWTSYARGSPPSRPCSNSSSPTTWTTGWPDSLRGMLSARGRGQVALLRVVADHPVRAELGNARRDGGLHHGDPFPPQAVRVLLEEQRHRLLLQDLVEGERVRRSLLVRGRGQVLLAEGPAV